MITKFYYDPIKEEKIRRESIEEGIEKKEKEVVKNMLRKRFPLDLIVEITGLNQEKIEEIKEETKKKVQVKINRNRGRQR